MASVKDVMEARARAEQAVAGLVDEMTKMYLGMGKQTTVCEICGVYGKALEGIAHLSDDVLYHGVDHALRHVQQLAQTALVQGGQMAQNSTDNENTSDWHEDAVGNPSVSIDMMEDIVGRHDNRVSIDVEKGDDDG